MNVYRIRDLSSDDHQVTDSFAGTMKLARQEVKETPVVFSGSIQVDLVTVKTNNGGLLAMLARQPEIAVVRSWRGTTGARCARSRRRPSGGWAECLRYRHARRRERSPLGKMPAV
jgi:hypothetical protein